VVGKIRNNLYFRVIRQSFKILNLMMRIVFLGPPGAGKGTQAEIISKKLNLRKISTGDILRSEMEKETELGKIAKSYMEKGELVPDEVMIKIIENNIKNLNGFILDGFPRTLNQAIELEKITKIDKVIYLNVPDDEIKKRLLNRGRLDDKPEVIENRIKVYREQTQPLIEFYRNKGILYEIDGIGAIEEITKRIEEILYER
jgi:adenylate kinase